MKPEITPAAEAALASVMANPLLGLLGWSRRYSRGADLLVGSLGAVDVRLYVRGESYPFRYCAVLPGGGNRSTRSLEGAILWLRAGVQSLLHGCRAVDPVVTQLVAEGARLRAERDEAREALLAACRLVESVNAEADGLRAAHAAAEDRAVRAWALANGSAVKCIHATVEFWQTAAGERDVWRDDLHRFVGSLRGLERQVATLTPPQPPQEAPDA